MYQKFVVDAVEDLNIKKAEYEEEMKKNTDSLLKAQNLKMYQFCSLLFQEFKYMNKLQEDKILFTVGYRDTMPGPLPHAKNGEVFNELLSVRS